MQDSGVKAKGVVSHAAELRASALRHGDPALLPLTSPALASCSSTLDHPCRFGRSDRVLDSGVRKAEVMVAVSRAAELTMGRPADFALRSCALAVELAQSLRFGSEDIREVFFHSLLRYIGCNAETYALAALFGDEILLRRKVAPLDLGRFSELVPVLLRLAMDANVHASTVARLAAVLKALTTSRTVSNDVFSGHCEVAERLGARLGFHPRIVRNLGQLYARWDGRGIPAGLSGEAISPAVRVVTLAQDMVILEEAHGAVQCLAILKKRSGKIYDPAMVACVTSKAHALLERARKHSSWDAVLALEPEPYTLLHEGAIDEMFLTLADMIDIKSPFTPGHSRAVAELAAEAGRYLGLPGDEIAILHRAGLVHDFGQAGIPTDILVKPGPLGDSDWEKVRLHPYHGERILARPPMFARLAPIVGGHHERIDGSGYHRGIRGDLLSPQARILAVAEAYQAMIEPRPHRQAMSAAQAAATVNQEVRAGKFDAQAATAVLAAAGHRVSAVRRSELSGLTAREVQVLRLIAGGQSIKQIAGTLGIAPKTADNHIQNLYAKISVKTRAGATLFAMEHGLMPLRQR